MAVKKGTTVTYHPGDGRPAVEAQVVSANEDKTVNLLYPHPRNEEVMASADGVAHGAGAFQYLEVDEVGVAAPTQAAGEAAVDQVGILQARVEVLQAELAEAVAAKEAAEKALEEARGENARLQAELEALTASGGDDKKEPAAEEKPKK